jgi:DNA-binding transcriptional regulator YiaG
MSVDTPYKLKSSLNELGITQEDFARLVGVTGRAVSLWMTKKRRIPGPIQAYMQLLLKVPQDLRRLEFNRLKPPVRGYL